MQYLVQPLAPHASHAPRYPGNTERLYAISAAPSGLALGSSGSKGQVRQQVWTGADAQLWSVISNGDGSFRVRNKSTSEYLDVSGGSHSNGALVQTFPGNNTDAQKWRFVEVENGHYKLENVESGKVLDLDSGAVLSGGADIQQWGSNDTFNQRWILCEVRQDTAVSEDVATVFERADYAGASKVLGLGSYAGARLPLSGGFASVRVPLGMRVTVFEQANFRGTKREFTADCAAIGLVPASILVENVATFYADKNFSGASIPLGVGRYDMAKGVLPNDTFSSVRVPRGMIVEVYQHYGFAGDFRTYVNDEGDLYALNDQISSIVIKEEGVIIPEGAIRFGDKLRLRSVYGKFLSLSASPKANVSQPGLRETFSVVRLGSSTRTDLVCFGDVIGLEANGYGLSVATRPGQVRVSDGRSADELKIESFQLFRAGPSSSSTFLSVGDVIALKPAQKTSFLQARNSGLLGLVSGKGELPEDCRFTVVGIETVEHETGACGAAVCGAATCAADFCGAAACGAATTVVGVCGVAAKGVAICGVDLGGAGFCGAAACGAAVVGFAACGADACNAAACGAAACGVAACGAAACGAEANVGGVCGAAATGVGLCGANACGAAAGGIDACGADACGANVCGLNLCAADACAADACGLDIIPIIPGI